MRLIYIVNSRIPTEKAYGWSISKMCSEFANLGVDVLLVVPKSKRGIKENLFNYYDLPENFRVKELFNINLIGRFKSVRFLPKLLFALQNFSFLLSSLFVKIKKDDLVYARNIEQLLFLPWKSKNVFFEVHFLSKKDKLFLPFIKKAKKIIVITKRLKEDLVNYGLPKEKILVAPSGVDVKVFEKIEDSEELIKKQCRQKLNLPQDKKIIGYLGQLKTMGMEKGVGDLIKALKILKEENPLICLCLVGGQESDINEYKKIALKIGLEKDILFIGQVKHSMTPYFLKSFDILAMPFPLDEHYVYYMSPIKLFEYMASKRPIVTSDLPSIREILNKNNAVLVRPENVQALVKGIDRLLKNNVFSDKLTAQAYKDVQQYTWQERAKKIIRFIENK